ncbi:MAG: PAS domain S-box protein, partial [Spirochaetia bacterium]|nr:PAS domain S-box protein [Spirochaetia bacterium]
MDQNLEKLSQALKDVRDLYDNAPCGYHSVDADGWFLEINDTELRWLGYKREEVIGKLKISDLLTPKSLEVFATKFPELKKRGMVRDIEVELRKKNGSTLPAVLNSTAIYADDGSFVRSRATMFDITERKRAERKLEESEARLLAFLSHIPAVIFVKDLDGRYLFVNEEFLRSFSFERGQVLFRTDAEIFPPEQAAHFITNDKHVIETRERIEFEESADYADGRHTSIVNKFPIIDDDGQIVALGGIATDITERQKTREVLEKVNRALRVLSATNE